VSPTGPSRDVVLAVGAHPDDLESQIGGTLAALAARGVEVHMATVTDGWCGSYERPGPEIARIRLEEARRAAAIAGAAAFHHLGMHDQGSETTIERRRELVDLIRRLGVTVLLGHPPNDYHVDHRNASELLFQARCAAVVPNFASEPPLATTPHLAYFDANEGVGFAPDIWIDVSAAFDVKRRMLAAHESQVDLLARMYAEDIQEMMERLSAFRGGQRATRYAEAFRGCGTYPEPDGALRFLIRTLEDGEDGEEDTASTDRSAAMQDHR
jgi:N-acetylglucosamine malate deacetylase 1